LRIAFLAAERGHRGLQLTLRRTEFALLLEHCRERRLFAGRRRLAVLWRLLRDGALRRRRARSRRGDGRGLAPAGPPDRPRRLSQGRSPARQEPPPYTACTRSRKP